LDDYTISKKLLDEEAGKEVLKKFISTYKETFDIEKSLDAADNVAERNGLRHFLGLSRINDDLKIVLKIYEISVP
jgi:hypothetical protein